MNDYYFEFCILKYTNMYFLEEEMQNLVMALRTMPMGRMGVIIYVWTPFP